jgi:nitrite reductase/ring-hydroxylating ferredoxin subunit
MLCSGAFIRSSLGLGRLIPPAITKLPRTRLPTTKAYTTTSSAMAREFKLKDISSLDLKAGEKREVEVEGVDGGKVLLCNVGGKVSAVGHKCTHYGAPLVKGVLTGNGRITCPWHGGLFIRRSINSWVSADPKYSLLQLHNRGYRECSGSRRSPFVRAFRKEWGSLHHRRRAEH